MSDDHTYTFNVTMSCSGCSGAVERVLKKLEGESFPLCPPSSHLPLLSLHLTVALVRFFFPLFSIAGYIHMYPTHVVIPTCMHVCSEKMTSN